MPPIATDTGLPVVKEARSAVVVIDPRVLFRESLIFQIRGDVTAPDVLGFSTIAQWQQVAREGALASVIVVVSPGVPIVILSELEDYHQVSEAMRRGLSGFIPMTSSVKVAQSAIALVLAGGCFVPSGIVCTRSTTPAAEGQARGSVRLTEREAAVLGALQIGKPNKVIAYELNMCTNTVKVHVRNIMKKLQAKNRTELAYLVNTKGVVSWGHRLGGAWFLLSSEHGAALQTVSAAPAA
jgi:DNA-binding NarL/FixJ family response regulator